MNLILNVQIIFCFYSLQQNPLFRNTKKPTKPPKNIKAYQQKRRRKKKEMKYKEKSWRLFTINCKKLLRIKSISPKYSYLTKKKNPQTNLFWLRQNNQSFTKKFFVNIIEIFITLSLHSCVLEVLTFCAKLECNTFFCVLIWVQVSFAVLIKNRDLIRN